jgi:3'-phosphoadenosine 5'-phosphosulfate sulfotransferase (PAPS reductase)/FAD synthetase
MTTPVLDDTELAHAARDLEGASPEEILRWTFDRFTRVALVASFQAESSVLVDIAARVRPGVDVITLDTGRLPEETLALIDDVQRTQPVRVHVISPDPTDVEAMTTSHGVNLFRQSRDLRQLCCDVRKDRPLRRALEGYDAWITFCCAVRRT